MRVLPNVKRKRGQDTLGRRVNRQHRLARTGDHPRTVSESHGAIRENAKGRGLD
jgi:hypothetical protein